jgi:hypothetical protein
VWRRRSGWIGIPAEIGDEVDVGLKVVDLGVRHCLHASQDILTEAQENSDELGYVLPQEVEVRDREWRKVESKCDMWKFPGQCEVVLLEVCEQSIVAEFRQVFSKFRGTLFPPLRAFAIASGP